MCVRACVRACVCACHTDREVCPVDSANIYTCCVRLPIYHKGWVPVDPVHVTHCTVDGDAVFL